MAPSAIEIPESDQSINVHEKTISIQLERSNGPLHVTNDDHAKRKLVGEALRKRVETIDHNICDPGDEDAFFVADLGEVYRQHLRWKLNLRRVKPFYGTVLFFSEVNGPDWSTTWTDAGI